MAPALVYSVTSGFAALSSVGGFFAGRLDPPEPQPATRQSAAASRQGKADFNGTSVARQVAAPSSAYQRPSGATMRDAASSSSSSSSSSPTSSPSSTFLLPHAPCPC